MKNSSRLALKIARNLTRSKSGVGSSSASSSTRALNSSQLNSRLMNSSGGNVCCSYTVPLVGQVFSLPLSTDGSSHNLILRIQIASENARSLGRVAPRRIFRPFALGYEKVSILGGWQLDTDELQAI